MPGPQEKFDAVIIGAGMSGLVCGCYLAKAGMKVAIAEQHSKPGGYCTSFKRKQFTFDAAAHSFGSNREGGNFNAVLKDLGLDNRLPIKRYNPSDIVVTPDYKISFQTDLSRTIADLLKAFPHEPRIRDFIAFLASPKPSEIAALRNKTFQDLLDQYFTDERLKAIVSFPLFGNGGLPPTLMSAFTGSKIFTEFIIDGGYYPEGGMQKLPDALAKRFVEFGGVLRLSSTVKQILVEGVNVSGVLLGSGHGLSSRYVISNCDARQTFFKLLGKQIISKEVIDKLNTMTPSLSMFIIYLGIDDYFDSLPQPGSTLWFLPNYDLQKMYAAAADHDKTDLTKYLFRVLPDGKSIIAMANTSFKDREYWVQNKRRLLETFITNIEQTTIRGLSKHIIHKEAATPYTLYRYTSNYQGAAYGWESTQQQFIDSDFRKPSFLNGFYLTGHWTTYAQGIAGVVYLGQDLAKIILRNKRI